MLYPLTMMRPVYFSSSGGAGGDVAGEDVRLACIVDEAGVGAPNTARYDFCERAGR